MGEVYLVEEVSSGNLRAAKVMRFRDRADADQLLGFRREALSLLNVGTHPFFVQLFDVRERSDDIVLLMEYVAAEAGCTTAEDLIRRKQTYKDFQIGAWSVEFCVGMEHALKCGIAAHRDIKPGNLLIGSGAFLKIADFGLALAASRYPVLVEGPPSANTRLQWMRSPDGRDTCGTPGYVAPELFCGGKASPQSDMFSFGVTLWQLAARSMSSPYGVRFDGDANAYQQSSLDLAIRNKVITIDTPFFDVIRRCLDADPACRYPDFPTLREAIKSAAKKANVRAMDFIVAPGLKGTLEDIVSRGRAYLLLGRHDLALRIIKSAVKHAPNSSHAILAHADALSECGQMVEAIRAYEAVHAMDPESDAPLDGMALAWLELRQPARARVHLERVLARHPDNLEALLLFARLHGQEGDAEAALTIVESVVAVDDNDWRAHEYHGRALRNLNRPADAAAAFAKCLVINPLALDARPGSAAIATEQNDISAAERQYEMTVVLFRDNPEALNKIAAHMAENGHPEKAIDLFGKIADAEPDSRSIMLVNMGNAHLRRDDAPAAAESYRRAIEADPTNALAFCRMGDLENEKGLVEEAADYFSQACELDTQKASYHASAGTAHLQNGDHVRAAIYLKRSIELFQEQPEILYNLAVALLQDSNVSGAVEELEKAVHLDPMYARGWFLKAHLEAHMGRADDAVMSASQALAIGSGLSAAESERMRSLAP